MRNTDFSDIIGNEPIKEYLLRMISRQAIANSLLFAGPSGIGKSLFAQRLAELVIASHSDNSSKTPPKYDHPDIHHYYPEGKMGLHSIQSLRQLTQEIYLPPFEATWKTFIIHEADHMLTYSANALLKTFEEPPPRTQIILLSSSPSSLLPTIRSRCRILYFQSISNEEIALFLQQRHGLDPEAAEKIAAISEGSLDRAIQRLQKGEDPLRAQLFDILMKVPFLLYREFAENVRKIADEIELKKNEGEDRLKSEKELIFKDSLSAVQRGAIEKEIEGAGALKFLQGTQVLFGYLLSWYRDLHLLEEGGAENYLMNPDYREQLLEKLKSTKLVPLEKVQKIIDEAILGLQRSTSLHICLESMLLKFSSASYKQ
jgi:DNA polymerase III subunit delta'